MKSIRLSLLLYFLALLAVALGAVSALAYQHTKEILKSKVEARERLAKKQYDEDSMRETRRFDQKLIENAFRLIDQAQAQLRLQGAITEFHDDLFHNAADANPPGSQATFYFQINNDNGEVWRSSSMGERTFP